MVDGISIALPTYDGYGGHAKRFLSHSLGVMSRQTYSNFEVIISDDSESDLIYDTCQEFSNLNIKYYRSVDINLQDRAYEKGMTPNLNRALRQCNRKIIKMLFQDDALSDEFSLERMYTKFTECNSKWLACGLIHTDSVGEVRFRPQVPSYHDEIQHGINTLGPPSNICIINEDVLLFDERLQMLMDCDYFKRCEVRYGPPTIVEEIAVQVRQHPDQISSGFQQDPSRLIAESEYVAAKDYEADI